MWPVPHLQIPPNTLIPPEWVQGGEGYPQSLHKGPDLSTTTIVDAGPLTRNFTNSTLYCHSGIRPRLPRPQSRWETKFSPTTNPVLNQTERTSYSDPYRTI